jgi:hypothetical protein
MLNLSEIRRDWMPSQEEEDEEVADQRLQTSGKNPPIFLASTSKNESSHPRDDLPRHKISSQNRSSGECEKTHKLTRTREYIIENDEKARDNRVTLKNQGKMR